MIRVALFDDHASFRDTLALILDAHADFVVTGHAGSLAEGRRLLPTLTADVAVLDLQFPDGHGADLISEVRRCSPQTAILVLTASDDALEVARVVEAGAAGVLHKAVGLDRILAALRRLAAGDLLHTEQEIRALRQLAAQHRDRDRAVHGAIARLTARERTVLAALADGLTDKEIAARLQISPETARNHVARLLRKLGVDSRLQAVVFAVGHGLVTVPRSGTRPPSTAPRAAGTPQTDARAT